MVEDDFHSLSKGVFVIPFNSEPQEESEAGPSRRPFNRLYTDSLNRYEQAHAAYEADCTAEQSDDISDWLERCMLPPLLRRSMNIIRLPIAIVQNASSSLGSLLPTISLAHTIHAREIPDLSSAVKAIATGFIGESALTSPMTGKKTGRTGIEALERWWKARKSRSPLLLHIDQAQQVQSTVLAELIYIFTLHPDLPIRLLLSVPSTSTFLSSWTPIEMSSIDICILQSGRTRRRTGAVNAILKEQNSAPLGISEDLADDLKAKEDLLGGGGASTLKSLKWLLLHQSMNSALAERSNASETNDADREQLQRLQALANAISAHPDDSTIPGREIFQLHPHQDLTSTQNPAPRISILHALSNSHNFIQSRSPIADTAETLQTTDDTSKLRTPASGKKSKRDHATMSGKSNSDAELSVQEERESQGDELRELQMLFELWRGAGRSVNLWDWLEGFRSAMTMSRGEEERDVGEMDVDDVESEAKRSKQTSSKGDHDGTDSKEKEDEEDTNNKILEEEEARLHAIFIRFCEEARMMGLVRARGKGRRADEVVKGVGLV